MKIEDLLTKVGRVIAPDELFIAEEKVVEEADPQEDILERIEARSILDEYGVLTKSPEQIMDLIDQDEKNEESESIHNWLFAAMERLEMC